MAQVDNNKVKSLEAQLMRASGAGQQAEVARLWQHILECDPDHVGALAAVGQNAFRVGDLARARGLLARLVEVDGSDQQQWLNLAIVCQSQQDEVGEAAAISGALRQDPRDMLALFLRANLLERQGKAHAAATAYGAVVSVAPPLEQLAPQLRPAVIQSQTYAEKYNHQFGSFMDQFLATHRSGMRGENLKRFDESVDIMFGRKKRYDSQSMLFHYPGLAPITFFEREEFPWLDPIEAATADIRHEFLQVLSREQGFGPYLTYSDDQPLNQFGELNNSLRWSAFHLLQNGQRVEANAAQCPLTMQALQHAPQPEQAGRTPSAMFSLLKPHTRIPPHVGVSNVRMVVHLPLIIPGQCGFRVGNDTREWVPGKAWVFDDTIEHEAWNDSDQLRVVLIFDIWHPHLSAAERAMISAMAQGIHAFSDDSGSFAL
jgi:aspartyl/asparaginyl beta-hydroxylase (cupin superfamily)